MLDLEERQLRDFVRVRTGKLDANAQRTNGAYPFFTCGEEVLRIDHYSFDTEAVLLAGNGNFNVKWYSGKFNAYQRTYVIEPLGVNGRWLFYLIRFLLPEIVKGNRGSTVRYIRIGDIVSCRAAVPPLAEQCRIVAKLESLFNHSKSTREELAHIPRLVERYKQAILGAVMETDETGQTWPRVPLEELLTDGPTNGYSPRSGENPKGTLSLKLTATTRGVMDLSERAVKRLNEVIPKDSKFWLRPGDILIQRSNSLEYVGMAAIYDGPSHKYIYPDLMIRIRVSSPTVARWICRYCSSAAGRRYFISKATGTAGNMPKINGSTIRRMQIPLPPMGQLEALLGRVDRALDAIGALQGEAGRAQQLLDRLD